jgi:hypothetical protein
MEKDRDGNPIRYYKVTYTRNMAGGKRLRATVTTSEYQLSTMLYDFHSRYAYIIESAVYLPDYEPVITDFSAA